jgi:hypothetical protein
MGHLDEPLLVMSFFIGEGKLPSLTSLSSILDSSLGRGGEAVKIIVSSGIFFTLYYLCNN